MARQSKARQKDKKAGQGKKMRQGRAGKKDKTKILRSEATLELLTCLFGRMLI